MTRQDVASKVSLILAYSFVHQRPAIDLTSYLFSVTSTSVAVGPHICFRIITCHGNKNYWWVMKMNQDTASYCSHIIPAILFYTVNQRRPINSWTLFLNYINVIYIIKNKNGYLLSLSQTKKMRCKVIRLLPVHAVSHKGRHHATFSLRVTDFKSSLLTHSQGN